MNDYFENLQKKYAGQESSVSVKVVAKHLSLSTSAIYKMAQRAVIPSFKVGKARRFKLSEVEASLKG
jgi:excisionase family DNA binding protein